MWRSWKSDRVRHQRSVVQIQSSKTDLQTFVYWHQNRKDENKEKEAGNGPFKINYVVHSFPHPLPMFKQTDAYCIRLHNLGTGIL